jgi:hypothetical protein
MATISELIPDVKLILQNRSDVLNYNPAMYIKNSIQELSQSYPFEELRVTGPRQTLTVNQYQYPVTFFENPGDDYSQIQALNIFTNPNTNTVAYPLHYDTPTGIQTLLFIPGGLPAKWTRFGDFIWVGPQPGQQYTVFMIYQRRHPFNDANLGSTPVLMPPEWKEIVEYCAAYRLAAGPLRWMDFAKELRILIYGDPSDPSEPGLIKRRFYQQQMDERLHSRNLAVVTGRR